MFQHVSRAFSQQVTRCVCVVVMRFCVCLMLSNLGAETLFIHLSQADMTGNISPALTVFTVALAQGSWSSIIIK